MGHGAQQKINSHTHTIPEIRSAVQFLNPPFVELQRPRKRTTAVSDVSYGIKFVWRVETKILALKFYCFSTIAFPTWQTNVWYFSASVRCKTFKTLAFRCAFLISTWGSENICSLWGTMDRGLVGHAPLGTIRQFLIHQVLGSLEMRYVLSTIRLPFDP